MLFTIFIAIFSSILGSINSWEWVIVRISLKDVKLWLYKWRTIPIEILSIPIFLIKFTIFFIFNSSHSSIISQLTLVSFHLYFIWGICGIGACSITLLIYGITSPLNTTRIIAPFPKLLLNIYAPLNPVHRVTILEPNLIELNTIVGINVPCFEIFHSILTTVVISPSPLLLNAILYSGLPDPHIGFTIFFVIIIPSIS